MGKIVYKTLNLKLNKCMKAKKYMFRNSDVKGMTKYKYRHILTKGNMIQPVLTVRKNNKWKVAYKTTLNQFNCVYIYKQRLCKDYKPKTKNVFYICKKKNKFLNTLSVLVLGLIIGFINGFWGGGGGMVCVPTLTGIIGLKDKKAHATAILIMLPLSIASFVVYMLKGSLKWDIAGIVSGGFVVGGVLGALLLKKINNIVLQIVFALVIIAGGIKMLL